MSFDSKKLLDDTGWQILQALQKNARIPFAELGRLVGLSALASLTLSIKLSFHQTQQCYCSKPGGNSYPGTFLVHDIHPLRNQYKQTQQVFPLAS
jgi:hypothetical protein